MKAVVGLGSNLGDRLEAMRVAVGELRTVATVLATSRVYATAPVGPPQPEYLNAAALITWNEDAEALLDALLAIESGLGRVRGEKWGPRTIDLDVLWIEGQAVATPRLVVPHPHLKERAFALAPMLEVAPGARDPATGEGYGVPQGQVRVVEEAGRL